MFGLYFFDWFHFSSQASPQSSSARQKKGHVCAETRANLREFMKACLNFPETRETKKHDGCIGRSATETAFHWDNFFEMNRSALFYVVPFPQSESRSQN